jgi:hypothetical protein
MKVEKARIKNFIDFVAFIAYLLSVIDNLKCIDDYLLLSIDFQ